MEHEQISRRSFIKRTALIAAGGAILAGCGEKATADGNSSSNKSSDEQGISSGNEIAVDTGRFPYTSEAYSYSSFVHSDWGLEPETHTNPDGLLNEIWTGQTAPDGITTQMTVAARFAKPREVTLDDLQPEIQDEMIGPDEILTLSGGREILIGNAEEYLQAYEGREISAFVRNSQTPETGYERRIRYCIKDDTLLFIFNAQYTRLAPLSNLELTRFDDFTDNFHFPPELINS